MGVGLGDGPGRRPPWAFGATSGPGGTPDDRDLARDAYRRRVAAQLLLDGGRAAAEIRALQDRLGGLGVPADLMGIPIPTAEELVCEWERLAGLYPAALAYWTSVGPDVEMTRPAPEHWLGYRDGEMLWGTGHMTVPHYLLQAALADVASTPWLPVGCATLRAVACHELGHVLERVIEVDLGSGAWRELQHRLAECRICAYTQDRPDESLAVAFAAAHHADDDRDGVLRAAGLVRSALARIRG